MQGGHRQPGEDQEHFHIQQGRHRAPHQNLHDNFVIKDVSFGMPGTQGNFHQGIKPVNCYFVVSSVGRLKRHMAEICVKAVVAVADLDRKDVNLDLIKVGAGFYLLSCVSLFIRVVLFHHINVVFALLAN